MGIVPDLLFGICICAMALGVIIYIAFGILIIMGEKKKTRQQQRSRRIHDYAKVLDQEGRKQAGDHIIENDHLEFVDDFNHRLSECNNNTVSAMQSIEETNRITHQHLEQSLHDHNELFQIQQDEIRYANTGIEFGGYNTDPEANPSMLTNDLFENNACSDPFPDSDWNSGNSFDSFDTGFNDPFGF